VRYRCVSALTRIHTLKGPFTPVTRLTRVCANAPPAILRLCIPAFTHLLYSKFQHVNAQMWVTQLVRQAHLHPSSSFKTHYGQYRAFTNTNELATLVEVYNDVLL
jgi:hypothetical protein